MPHIMEAGETATVATRESCPSSPAEPPLLTATDSQPFLALPAAKRVILFAGALGSAYTQLTQSPAILAYARSLGATGLHAGILGALPQGMLFMQLLSALAAGAGVSRKWRWYYVSLVQRASLLPLALGPWLLPQLPDSWWLWILLALAAANQGLAHFGTPLWLSWMGDYLPHAGLNRFWGRRQCGNQWAAAVALLTAALLVLKSGLSAQMTFSLLIVVSSLIGMIDILCFQRIEEPASSHPRQVRAWDVLSAPFRRRDFRTFIFFNCFWNLSAMVGAPFISLYLLEHVGMDLFHVLLLWTCSWVGGSLVARRLGNLAECHGERSVLLLCLSLKPLLMLALLLVPQSPSIAFWCLAPAFALDQALNAGIEIANNGFMLKRSPRENRTMFIAAGTAFAGLTGGVTAIIAGAVLGMTSDWSIDWHGATITNFHALFALSVLLRISAAFLAAHLPDSHPRVPVWKMLGVVIPQLSKLAPSGVEVPRLDNVHAPAVVARIHGKPQRRNRRTMTVKRAA